MRLRSLTNVYIEQEGQLPQLFSAGSEFEVDDEQAAGFLENQLAEKVEEKGNTNQEPHALGDETAATPDAESGVVADGQTAKIAPPPEPEPAKKSRSSSKTEE